MESKATAIMTDWHKSSTKINCPAHGQRVEARWERCCGACENWLRICVQCEPLKVSYTIKVPGDPKVMPEPEGHWSNSEGEA